MEELKNTLNKRNSGNSEPYLRYFLFLILLLLFFSSGCKEEHPVEPAAPSDIFEKLKLLPGVNVREVAPLYGYPRAFEIDLLQPVDHNNPDGEKFYQKIYLSHADETMPVIFAPSGYGASLQSVQEIAGIMGTNHLSVSHRFFIGSEPNPLDWNY